MNFLSHIVLFSILCSNNLNAQNINKTSSTNRLREDCLDCPPSDRPASSIWGLSVDISFGWSMMSFGDHEAYNPPTPGYPGGQAIFHSDSTPNFFGRISFEPISFFVKDLTAHVAGEITYRLGTSFKVRDAALKHTDQFQYGILGRIAGHNNSVGLGIDVRNDHMVAKPFFGSGTECTESRIWLRFQYRYSFAQYRRNKWFLGAEYSVPLNRPNVNPIAYYRDFVVNSGNTILGTCYTAIESDGCFPQGHLPRWDLGVIGGYRFGRLPMWKAESSKRPVFYNAIRERELRQKMRDAAELERMMTLEAVKFRLYPRTQVLNSSIDESDIETDSSKRSIDRIKSDGFESLLIHFATNKNTLTKATKEAIDKWVEQVWQKMKYQEVFQDNQLMIVGHCDERGTETHNRNLSWNRANALSNYLRQKHGINVSNIVGFGTYHPLSDKLADNRYAWLVFAPEDKRNIPFDQAKIIIRGPIVNK